MKILAIDPGEETGWCYLSPEGVIDLGQLIGQEAVVEFLEKWSRPVDAVVVEDYEMVPKFMKMNMGRKKGKMITMRILGYVEGWCMRHKIKYHLATPRDNRLNAKKSGMDPYAHNHKHTHWAFAHNHGYRYLLDRGLVKSALAKAMGK